MDHQNNTERIMFFVPSCNPGGTERVAQVMANELALQKFDVIIATMSTQKFPYPINKDISIYSIEKDFSYNNVLSKIFRFFYRAIKLRNLVKTNKVDIMISMGEYPILLNLVLPNKILKVARITNSMTSLFSYKDKILKKIIRKALLSTDLVILPSEHLKFEFEQSANNFRQLNNPIDIQNIQKLFKEKISLDPFFFKRYFIHVGQLVYQKNQSDLLIAFSKICRVYPNVGLVIIGEGNLREQLLEKVKYLGIENNVLFTGWLKNPFPFIRNAEAFVLSSRWEGLPNVLIESMACGCPIISYDVPTGPKSLLEDSKWGVLLKENSPDSLTKAMEKMLLDKIHQDKFKDRSVERVKDFDIKNVTKDFLEIVSYAYEKRYQKKFQYFNCS